MIRSASSYLISKIPSRTVPAVVVMIDRGCSRADIPSTITSYRFLSWIAWSSSIREQWTLRPSSVLESLDKGLNTPSLNSLVISWTNVLIRLLNTGDFLTMRLDSSQMIFAWSFLVSCVIAKAFYPLLPEVSPIPFRDTVGQFRPGSAYIFNQQKKQPHCWLPDTLGRIIAPLTLTAYALRCGVVYPVTSVLAYKYWFLI